MVAVTVAVVHRLLITCSFLAQTVVRFLDQLTSVEQSDIGARVGGTHNLLVLGLVESLRGCSAEVVQRFDLQLTAPRREAEEVSVRSCCQDLSLPLAGVAGHEQAKVLLREGTHTPVLYCMKVQLKRQSEIALLSCKIYGYIL